MAEMSYDKLDQWINDYITRINTYVKSKNKVIRSKKKKKRQIKNEDINNLLKLDLLNNVISAYKEIINTYIDEANKNDKLTKIVYLEGNIKNIYKEDGVTSDNIRIIKEIFCFFDEIAFYIEMNQKSQVNSPIETKLVNEFVKGFKELIKPIFQKRFDVMIKEVKIRIDDLTKIYNDHIKERLGADSKPSIGEIIKDMIEDIDNEDGKKNNIFNFRTKSLDNYIIENLENKKTPFIIEQKLLADDIYSQYFPEAFKTFEIKNEDNFKDIFINENIKTFLYDYLLENPAKVLYLEKNLKLDPQKLNDLNLIYKIMELIIQDNKNEEISFKPIIPIDISKIERGEANKPEEKKGRVFLDEEQLFYAHKNRYIACVYENYTYHLMEDNLFEDINDNMTFVEFKKTKLFNSISLPDVNVDKIRNCSVFKRIKDNKITDLSIDLFEDDNKRKQIIEIFLDNGNRIIDLSQQTSFLENIEKDSAVYYYYDKKTPTTLGYIRTKDEYNEKRNDTNFKVLPRNITNNTEGTSISLINAKNLVPYEIYIEAPNIMKGKLQYQKGNGEAETKINNIQGEDGTNPVSDEIFKTYLEYDELANAVTEDSIRKNIQNKELQDLPIYFMVSAVKSASIQGGIHSSLLILYKNKMYSVGFGFNDDTATHGISHMIEKLNGALYTPDSMIPGNILNSSDFNRQNPYATKIYKYKISDYGIFTEEMYNRLKKVLKEVNYKDSYLWGTEALLMTPKMKYCELSRGTNGPSNCSNFVLNIIGPSRVTCDIRLLPGIPNMISGLSIDAPNYCIRRNLRFFSPSQAVIEMFKYYINGNDETAFKRFIKLCHMDQGGILDIAATYGSPFLATYKLFTRKTAITGGKKRRTKKKRN